MSETTIHPLRMLRTRLNLTQKRLAEETGVGAQTILRAEHNKPINAESRRLLCKYFAMTSEELGLVSDINDTGEEEQAMHTEEEGGRATTPQRATAAPPVLSQAIAQGIVLATRELESFDMDRSRRNFLQILGITSSALVTSASDYYQQPLWEHLLRALERPSGIDETTLLHLEAVVRDCWRVLTTMLGAFSHVLLRYVLERLIVVGDLLERTTHQSSRIRLAIVASELAQVAGEILFDLKENEQAEHYYNVAMGAARVAQNDAMQAVILGRKSFIPIYEREATRAVPLLEHAHVLTKQHAPDITRAWLSAIEAEAMANAQNEFGCLQALAKSEFFLERGQLAEQPHPRFTSTILQGYRGICYIKLRQPLAAQKVLNRALAESDPQRIRHRSILLTDLATTYIHCEEIEEACKYASQALTLLSQSRSTRVLERIAELRRLLEPWKTTAAVQHLDEQMAELQPLVVHK
jgi:transcriptional regulator with XRE-family HTH domain